MFLERLQSSADFRLIGGLVRDRAQIRSTWSAKGIRAFPIVSRAQEFHAVKGQLLPSTGRTFSFLFLLSLFFFTEISLRRPTGHQ